MADITQNPDYRLVMTFLQNIRPGDMDQESADQLMMIGQRMQAGGALTEREREMFTSVVGNMPQMPMDPGSAVREDQWMPMRRDGRDANATVQGSAVRRGEMSMGCPRVGGSPTDTAQPRWRDLQPVKRRDLQPIKWCKHNGHAANDRRRHH
jgi:hypothetical protein